MSTVVIQTPRLLIKNWSLDLAKDFLFLTQDTGFTQFPITDYRQKDLTAAKIWILNNPAKLAVFEKESSELIGMGGLTPWRYLQEDLIDLTYRLRTSAQGKGYGFELASALVDYGFNQLKIDQITATITPDNLASKKLAEKLGMKFDRPIELLGVPTDLYRIHSNLSTLPGAFY